MDVSLETDAATRDGDASSGGNGVAVATTTGVGVLVAAKVGLGVLVGVGVGWERATALPPIANPSRITSPAINNKRETHPTNKTLLRKRMENHLSDDK